MSDAVPQEILALIPPLVNQFSSSIDDPSFSKEDLSQDLILLYLTKKDATRTNVNEKGYWFITFKHYLINVANRQKIQHRIFDKTFQIDERTA